MVHLESHPSPSSTPVTYHLAVLPSSQQEDDVGNKEGQAQVEVDGGADASDGAAEQEGEDGKEQADQRHNQPHFGDDGQVPILPQGQNCKAMSRKLHLSKGLNLLKRRTAIQLSVPRRLCFFSPMAKGTDFWSRNSNTTSRAARRAVSKNGGGKEGEGESCRQKIIIPLHFGQPALNSLWSLGKFELESTESSTSVTPVQFLPQWFLHKLGLSG